MCKGKRPIGAAKGKQTSTMASCQTPLGHSPHSERQKHSTSILETKTQPSVLNWKYQLAYVLHPTPALWLASPQPVFSCLCASPSKVDQ